MQLTGSGFISGARYQVAVLGTDGRRCPVGEFVGVVGVVVSSTFADLRLMFA